jgi:hypothetical protein
MSLVSPLKNHPLLEATLRENGQKEQQLPKISLQHQLFVQHAMKPTYT